MSENIVLHKPTTDLKDAYISLYEDWVNSGKSWGFRMRVSSMRMEM